MCNLNCSNCACKTLYAEEYNKLLLDDVPAGSAAMIAHREMVETELDLGLEDFLETLDRREFARE